MQVTSLIHFHSYPSRFSTLESLSWNTFFRSISDGFLGVFIPVYIFLLGQTGRNMAAGLVTVGLFVIIMRLVVAVLAIPVARLIKKVGFRRSIFLGAALESVTFSLLIVAKDDLNYLWWSAFVAGVSILFYWLSRLSLVSIDSQSDRMGRSIGLLELIGRGSAVLGPLAGGIIATVFGFQVLLLIGLLMRLVSALPMIFMPPHDHQEKPSLPGFWRWCHKRSHRGLIIGFIGRSVSDKVESWVWPLFVFLLVGGLELFGGLTSAVLLISMIAVFCASLLFDHNQLKLGRLSLFAVLGALTQLLRGAAGGVISLFALDSLSRVATPFYLIGTDGPMFLSAKEETPLVFFTYREIIYSLGNLFAAVILVAFAASLFIWWIMWALAAGGILLGLGLYFIPGRKVVI